MKKETDALLDILGKTDLNSVNATGFLGHFRTLAEAIGYVNEACAWVEDISNAKDPVEEFRQRKMFDFSEAQRAALKMGKPEQRLAIVDDAWPGNSARIVNLIKRFASNAELLEQSSNTGINQLYHNKVYLNPDGVTGLVGPTDLREAIATFKSSSLLKITARCGALATLVGEISANLEAPMGR